MTGRQASRVPWHLVRAALEERPDPYAGADVESARRLVPLLAVLSAVLTLAFLPMVHPTGSVGNLGWAIAGLIVVGQLAAVRRLVDPRRPASFNQLLGFSYAGVASVAVLEWLAGHHSPYMLLLVLWLGSGVGVHPPRRAVPFLLVVLAAGALPLVYDGRTSRDVKDVITTNMLWLAIGVVLMVLIATVRAQRVELRTGARSAREEAAEAERRVRALQEVTDVALAQLPLDDLLSELLARVARVLDLDAAAIYLLDESGDFLSLRAFEGVAADPDDGSVRIALGEGCAGRVAAERRTIALEEIEDTRDLDPLFRRTGVRALLGVPLMIDRRVIGVLQAASRSERHFSDDEMRLLELGADRLAQAIDRTRVNERAHHIAETLQRALLPARLPELPGVALAARYLPGGHGTEVGGDWYDVVPFPDGRVGLVMGDVVGRGVGAAALMGQLRNGLRVYSLEHDDPGRILDRMNVLLSQLEPDQMSTAVVLMLDPMTRRVSFATAGHPPPIVLGPDGVATFMESTPSVPLGILPYGRYASQERSLPAGATLLLYTDGLVERRGSSLRAGLSHLRATLSAAPLDPDLLCEHVLKTLLPLGPPGDDVALLALQSVPIAGPRLHLELDADPDELAVVRRSLEHWLSAASVDERDARRVTLACNEAAMNAIEHGNRAGSPGFVVDAELASEAVAVTVRDHGSWREPRDEGDGRGFDMMRALMDEVDVRRADDGTTVRLLRAVRRDGPL